MRQLRQLRQFLAARARLFEIVGEKVSQEYQESHAKKRHDKVDQVRFTN